MTWLLSGDALLRYETRLHLSPKAEAVTVTTAEGDVQSLCLMLGIGYIVPVFLLKPVTFYKAEKESAGGFLPWKERLNLLKKTANIVSGGERTKSRKDALPLSGHTRSERAGTWTLTSDLSTNRHGRQWIQLC